MHARDDEMLVILDAPASEEAEQRIRTQYRVMQQVSPRVLVIRRPADPAALRALPGVQDVAEGSVPDALVRELSDAEALFVQAWSQRASMGAKRRPGEGLPWDTPGRTPPDPPPHASGEKQGGN